MDIDEKGGVEGGLGLYTSRCSNLITPIRKSFMNLAQQKAERRMAGKQKTIQGPARKALVKGYP